MSDRSNSSKHRVSELESELAALRREVSQGQPATALPKRGSKDTGNGRPTKKPKNKKHKKDKKGEKSAKKSKAQKNQRQRAAGASSRILSLGRGLSGWWFQQFGAWGFSVIIHMVVFVFLGLLMLPLVFEPEPPELTALQERDEEELTQLLDEKLTPTFTASPESSQSVLTKGHVQALESISEPKFDQEFAESTDGPKVNIGDLNMNSLRGNNLTLPVVADAPGDPRAVVDGYDEAMDRITQEILLMLANGKVLVVWCFDQSESMKDDQDEIRLRISKVYKELGLNDVAKGDALHTAVVSYGSKVRLQTPHPTSSVTAIEKAISEIPIDKTGEEMMCMAVGTTIKKLQPIAAKGGRQMALILVTDESGDKQTNITLLEAVIAQAKAARCRIYVLGRESVFGYPYAHYLWRHPQTGHLHKIPIDRGPETPYAEQLQTSGFRRRYDSHPSGFGPYEQARMAWQTGGIFFMLPSIEANLVQDDSNSLRLVEAGRMTREEYRKLLSSKRRFQLEALRPFMPSLDTRKKYAAERDSSPMRKALWVVITMLNPYDPQKAAVIDMRLSFSGDPKKFANELRVELQHAKLYFEFLKLAEDKLEELASLRSREIYPRWQANYDLMYAQVLAYKIRLHEYGAYLQTFAQALNRNPEVREEAIAKLGRDPRTFPLRKPHPTNKKPGHYLRLAVWNIVHRPEMITGELTKSDVERSRRMFESVIANHPDTPWSDRAAWELKRGFGVELLPRYHYHHPPGKPGPRRPARKLIPVPKL